ncbi:MAG TPA: winged helix-turn-helix transcriptional regulator [Pseudonocardiaceae bacterium]|nr:winged helix-turn-helix transcriptional regulator [Pseudonocardiaceae bacterium]
MPTTRTYGDACAIARALDVVGERWAMLVVRELLLGPQRFSDLRAALPHASSNLVADRLRELSARGVVHKRKLPPPAGSWVYELTDWGRALEPVLLALGEWAMDVPLPLPPPPVSLSPTSVLIFLRGTVRPGPRPATFRVDLDGRPFTVRTERGRVSVAAGEPDAPDAVLTTTPTVLNDLLTDPASFDTALADATIAVDGNVAAVRSLIRSALRAVPQRRQQ